MENETFPKRNAFLQPKTKSGAMSASPFDFHRFNFQNQLSIYQVEASRHDCIWRKLAKNLLTFATQLADMWQHLEN